MNEIVKYAVDNYWGDIASVIGLFVSLIGFAVTIWNVVRSKKAAQKAEEAVLKMRETIQRSDTIMEFSAAITIMDEIKRLHRAAAWNVLPDRYSMLRRLLISIRSANYNLPDNHRAALQSAIQHFSGIENKVERALTTHSSLPNVAKLNEIVSTQIDKLTEVLTAIRQEIGVEYYGRQQTHSIDSTLKPEDTRREGDVGKNDR